MKKNVVCGVALALVLWACDSDSTVSFDQDELQSNAETSSSVKSSSSSSQKAKSSSNKSTRSSSSKKSNVSSSSKEKSSSSATMSSSAVAVEKSSSSNNTKKSSSSSEEPVSSAPAPVTESSSSVEPVPPVLDLSSSSFSSSSVSIVESSSDAAVLQHARNIASECMKIYGAKVDLLADIDGNPPSATYYMSAAGEMKVVLENLSLPCGAIVTDVSVSLSGDTLYVEPAYDESSMFADCICPTQVSFELENGLAYATALYLTFDRNNVMTLKEGTALSEKDRLKKTGYVRGTCQKDEPPVVETRATPANGSKDLPVALLGFENGMYVMTVSNVEDFCKIESLVLQKRSGDTLFVDYEDLSNASRCICTFDEHKFAIDAENDDVKYFSFKSTLFRVDRMVYD